MRRYFKHSRQCFIGYPSTSNFVKNTPLRVVFSTLFSVFGYPDETQYFVFDILLLTWRRELEAYSVACNLFLRQPHVFSVVSVSLSLGAMLAIFFIKIGLFVSLNQWIETWSVFVRITIIFSCFTFHPMRMSARLGSSWKFLLPPRQCNP